MPSLPSTRRSNTPLSWHGFWLLLCGWLVVTGWSLSAFGWLNRIGFAASFLIALTLLALWKPDLSRLTSRGLRVFRRRFRRFPAFFYVVIFLMALIGGIIYAPSNYDALGYRLPRMLQWIAEGGWHWVHTSHQAVNTRSSATEWISLPLLLFTSTDRLLFLPNILSFALLPGLVFGILIRLGVARRTAWQWMWIFPSGYCYALQAGGIGNDLTGAVLFLGGMFYALKARTSRSWCDFTLACLGMALATGAKSSNVPLGLPWLLALLPAIPLAWKFPLRSLALAPVLLLCSFLPNAFLNHKHCGDWTGLKAEPVLMRGGDPLLYVSWNIPYLLVQNLTPPVFPLNKPLNRKIAEMIPPDLNERLEQNFEPAASKLNTPETMMEENGPLGLGVVALLVVGTIGGTVLRRKSPLPEHGRIKHHLLWLVFSASLLSLLPMLLKSGLSGSGRYLAPHYLLLILPFLTSNGILRFLHTRIWKASVGVAFAALMLTMVISAARPLWPALTVLKSVQAEKSGNPSLKRAWDVYTFYRHRPDAFLPLVAKLPPGLDRLGMLSGNTPESSLWKPFGSRKIIHIRSSDSPESIHQRGIQYIAAGPRTMSETGFPELPQWCRQYDASIVAEAQVHLMVRKGIETWYLLKINPPTANLENQPERGL